MIRLIRLCVQQLKTISTKHWLGLLLVSYVNKGKYYKNSFSLSDEDGLREYGKLFSLAPSLYFEGLKYNSDKQVVLGAVINILKEITLWKYSKVYPPGSDLQTFVSLHKAQNEKGFLVYNKWEDTEDSLNVHRLKIKNCYFYNTFKRYGVPDLTLAFCMADEEYFSTFSDHITFHREQKEKNTIARGGDYCLFHFESK